MLVRDKLPQSYWKAWDVCMWSENTMCRWGWARVAQYGQIKCVFTFFQKVLAAVPYKNNLKFSKSLFTKPLQFEECGKKCKSYKRKFFKVYQCFITIFSTCRPLLWNNKPLKVPLSAELYLFHVLHGKLGFPCSYV